MTDTFLAWLTRWEPLWLLIVLVAELIYSIRIHHMAQIEFEYDKEWNERVKARRKKKIEADTVKFVDPVKLEGAPNANVDSK